MDLRPYQGDALQRTRMSYGVGYRAPILVAPTGAGKTVMASAVISAASAKGKEIWFLAHRFELVEQAARKLATCGISHRIIAPTPSITSIKINQFRELGRSWVDARSNVSVGTVQTVSRRLDGTYKEPDLIIIDECHLSIATSYQKVVDAYPNAMLLGLTATPTRLDGKGLGKHCGGLYDDLILLCEPQYLVDEGFLVEPRIFSSSQQIDLSGVKTVMGDFDKKELESRVDKPSLIGDAVDHYRKHAHGRPAIAFCVSVKHAEHVAAEFRAAGYKAVAVSGESDPEERSKAIAGLATGDVEIVCNCSLYIEGLDQPCISCVLLLTPTESVTRYLQSVGRGLRTYPGKTDCIVLDHAGNVHRHGFPTDTREWTLNGKQKRGRKKEEQQEQEAKVMTCEKCFAIYKPALICPVCGHAHEIKERKLVQADGELIELERQREIREKKKEVGRAQTFEQLLALEKARGYKPGWAAHVWRSRMRRAG